MCLLQATAIVCDAVYEYPYVLILRELFYSEREKRYEMGEG